MSTGSGTRGGRTRHSRTKAQTRAVEEGEETVENATEENNGQEGAEVGREVWQAPRNRGREVVQTDHGLGLYFWGLVPKASEECLLLGIILPPGRSGGPRCGWGCVGIVRAQPPPPVPSCQPYIKPANDRRRSPPWTPPPPPQRPKWPNCSSVQVVMANVRNCERKRANRIVCILVSSHPLLQ